jgi:hypothetical protein
LHIDEPEDEASSLLQKLDGTEFDAVELLRARFIQLLHLQPVHGNELRS